MYNRTKRFSQHLQSNISVALEAVSTRHKQSDIAILAGLSPAVVSRVACNKGALDAAMLIAEVIDLRYTFTMTNNQIDYTIEPPEATIKRMSLNDYKLRKVRRERN